MMEVKKNLVQTMAVANHGTVQVIAAVPQVTIGIPVLAVPQVIIGIPGLAAPMVTIGIPVLAAPMALTGRVHSVLACITDLVGIEVNQCVRMKTIRSVKMVHVKKKLVNVK